MNVRNDAQLHLVRSSLIPGMNLLQGHSLSQYLSSEQKAEMKAYISLVQNVMVMSLVRVHFSITC